MGKDSSFYGGQTVYFSTKHGKEEIVRPLFHQIGLHCEPIEVDTDRFGTFSGEVERIGSVRATLRKKIQSAFQIMPSGRLFLASEGSFGPDPLVGLLQTDLESLLLWDRELEMEIYAEYLCREPIHGEATLGPRDDFHAFLKSINFPRHAVMVRPEGMLNPIFKGLKTEREVAQSILESFCHSKNGKVTIATDLRADQNETRRNAIFKAGQALIEKILSLCPNCSVPGFGISRGIPGLKCEGCGEATSVARAVLFECAKCGCTRERARPDGRERLPIEECEFCNP